jgi:hypothetical protein
MSDEELRAAMAPGPNVVQSPDGTPLFGFRCWPGVGEQPVVDALLDELGRHAGAGFEVYAIVVDRENWTGDGRTWAEAWRVSDRTRVEVGTLDEVIEALSAAHDVDADDA